MDPTLTGLMPGQGNRPKFPAWVEGCSLTRRDSDQCCQVNSPRARETSCSCRELRLSNHPPLPEGARLPWQLEPSANGLYLILHRLLL